MVWFFGWMNSSRFYISIHKLGNIFKTGWSQSYLLCCQKSNAECGFIFLFLIIYFFIAQFLCERSIKLLFLLYKIVVHKNEIQKCKYLGHVSFIYHVWCFLYSKLFCKCASMLEYVLENETDFELFSVIFF